MVSLHKNVGMEYETDDTSERATFIESAIEGGWSRDMIISMTRNYLGALADVFRGRI